MTVSMPTELDDGVDEEATKHGMTYSEYVRTVLRNSVETPFDPRDIDLVVEDSDAEEAQSGAA